MLGPSADVGLGRRRPVARYDRPMPIPRPVRSPLVLSVVITIVLVVTSVGMTVLLPDDSVSGTDELPALQPTGSELAVWAVGIVVLYVGVLASVMFVRWLRRPTAP